MFGTTSPSTPFVFQAQPVSHKPRRVSTICRWGVGNELVALFQNHSQQQQVRTLAFDSFPVHLRYQLDQAGERELQKLSKCKEADKKQILEISQRLRGHATACLKESSDELWKSGMRSVLSCWKVLEIQLLTKQVSARIAVVRFIWYGRTKQLTMDLAGVGK